MKSIKVYLNVYDFMSFNNCMSTLGLSGYHTGIEIQGRQYCFCVVSTDLEESGVMVIQPESADFHFNQKILLGQIQITREQFRQILKNKAKEFTCGKYHMFSNNCNHFCNEFAKELLKIELPSWIFRSTNILTYLCCCLPHKFVSGQWALEVMLEKELQRQQVQKSLVK